MKKNLFRFILVLALCLMVTPSGADFYSKRGIFYRDKATNFNTGLGGTVIAVITPEDPTRAGPSADYGQMVVSDAYNAAWWLSVTTGGYPRMSVFKVGSIMHHAVGTTQLQAGQPYVIAGTYLPCSSPGTADGYAYIYVNGVLDGTSTAINNVLRTVTTWNFNIGGWSTTSDPTPTANDDFWGDISAVYVWDRYLNAKQVESISRSLLKGQGSTFYSADLRGDFRFDAYPEGTDLHGTTEPNYAPLYPGAPLTGSKYTTLEARAGRVLSFR